MEVFDVQFSKLYDWFSKLIFQFINIWMLFCKTNGSARSIFYKTITGFYMYTGIKSKLCWRKMRGWGCGLQNGPFIIHDFFVLYISKNSGGVILNFKVALLDTIHCVLQHSLSYSVKVTFWSFCCCLKY